MPLQYYKTSGPLVQYLHENSSYSAEALNAEITEMLRVLAELATEGSGARNQSTNQREHNVGRTASDLTTVALGRYGQWKKIQEQLLGQR